MRKSRIVSIAAGLGAMAALAGAGASAGAGQPAQPTATAPAVSASAVPPGGTLLPDGRTREYQTPSGAYRITVLASWSDCPSGWVCLFENAGGGGSMWQFQSAGVGWQNLQSYGAYPYVSAVWNRRGLKVFFGSGTAGGGIGGSGPLCYTSPTQVSYIGSVWNDKPRSINIVTNNNPC